jgi:hypothetical protein
MVACTGGHPKHTSVSPSPRASVSPPTPTVTATPEVTLLDPLVLDVDLFERPRRWQRVAFIPFGAAEDRLGFRHYPESVDSLPASFQIADDGTLWIADRHKDRLAHFTLDGRYLGAIPQAEPLARIRDFVISDGTKIELVEGPTYDLREVAPDGTTVAVAPKLNGKLLALEFLYPASPGPVFLAEHYRIPPKGDIEPGPSGIWTSDPSGTPTLLPGLPSGDDRWMWVVDGPSQNRYRFQQITPSTVTERPFRFRCRVRVAGRISYLPCLVGEYEQTPVNDGRDLLMMVQMSPSRPGDQDRFGGGRWLLRLGASPVIWERMPDRGRSDELQKRHIAVGPDGAIYEMRAMPDGMEILRRP